LQNLSLAVVLLKVFSYIFTPWPPLGYLQIGGRLIIATHLDQSIKTIYPIRNKVFFRLGKMPGPETIFGSLSQTSMF
jgi:hypothetical protein